MPLGPFAPIPPREKIRRSHINDLRTALTGIQDAYDVAVANGFVGTRGQWLASLKGDPGEPGAGVMPLGSVATVDDLDDIVSPAVNDVYTVDADGHAYRWSGSAWVDIGQFRGDPGDLSQAVADTLYADKGVEGTVDALETTATGLQVQINALGEGLDAIANAPTTLPVTAGLLARWDAHSLAVADGARVSAWTDDTTGKVAAQAASGNQPRFDAAGLNGRPALYFDKARNDNLVASGLTAASHYSTLVAVVHRDGKPSGDSAETAYYFGTNGSEKNALFDQFGRVAAQTSSVIRTVAQEHSAPRVVTTIWNNADSLIRVSGTTITGSTGAASTLPTAITIGHRATLQDGRGMQGWVGDILYYDRVLSVAECAAVEAYLAARWDIDITQQRVWHLDSVHGDDARDGRTPSRALKTLGATVAAINNTAPADATVVIHAPEATPLRETDVPMVSTGGTVRLVPRYPGQAWHAWGSQRFDGGWTHDGGGVYSRTVTFPAEPPTPVAFLPDLLDAEGLPTRVWTRNTTTPATPAAGEYGYSGTTYTLHLANDANPNLYRVEIATARFLIQAAAGTMVTITDGYLAGTQLGSVMAGSTTLAGTVYAIDSTAEYSRGSGFATMGPGPEVTAVRCAARYVFNDGFNHHADAGVRARMVLIDCEGAYNDDEGVSPHDDTMLLLVRGRYHHNGSGGLTSVDRAATQLVDTEFDGNGRLLASEYGVNVDVQSTLVSTRLYSHDNIGGGISITSTATTPWVDNGGTRSGIEHGNALPDQV